MLPRTAAFQGKNIHDVTYPELAQSILDVDTAGWAESWEVLRKRIIEGFYSYCRGVFEGTGGGDAFVVSHSMTIATFCLVNGSFCRASSIGQRFGYCRCL